MSEITKVSYGGELLDVRDEVFGIRGEGAPTTATVGVVGQLYEDTTNGVLYQCTAAQNSVYTWEKVQVAVSQATGTSTTDVMSQKAVTDHVNTRLSGLTMRALTQQEYSRLTVKDPNTLYVIKEG